MVRWRLEQQHDFSFTPKLQSIDRMSSPLQIPLAPFPSGLRQGANPNTGMTVAEGPGIVPLWSEAPQDILYMYTRIYIHLYMYRYMYIYTYLN